MSSSSIVTFPTTIQSYADLLEQPEKIIVPLKVHQRATLKKCIELEKKQTIEHDEFAFTPFFGVIGDCVGSGKSLSVLSLIALNPEIEARYFKISNSNVLNGMFEYHEYNDTQKSNDTSFLKCNVLFVPHSIRHQWTQYIQTQTRNISFFVVENNETLREIDDALVQSIDLLIISSTFAGRFNRWYDYKFRRVIVDEVDTTNVTGGLPKALFYWFVSSSVQNLFYWDGHHIRLENGEYGHIKGLKPTNSVYHIFRQVDELKLWKYFLVKNDDKVVQQGLSLPKPIKKRCMCRALHSAELLKDLLDPTVLQMLNADNIHGALRHLNCTSVTETNLIDAVLQNEQKQLIEFQRKYRNVMERDYKHEHVKHTQLQKCQEKINMIESRIRNIKQRIQENSSLCGICYTEPENRTFTPCCHHGFCFTCLAPWIAKHTTCPMCRQTIHIDELVVVSTDDNSTPVHQLPTKMEKLLEKLNTNSRALVFAMFDETLEQVESTLNRNSISYQFINGCNKIIQQKIKKFKNGDVQVLLLNSKHYAAGLNLECATDVILYHDMDRDMEKQCIGRAQRIGRSTPLRVWKFVTEIE